MQSEVNSIGGVELSASESLVEVVIVNYRTPRLTLDCVDSLIDYVLPRGNLHVTIVDNASHDNSVELLRQGVASKGWGHCIEVLALERNGGFAFGNNEAIKRVLANDRAPDYVWLLNPDTIVRRGALDSLIETMQSDPVTGLVGSRLEHLDATPQRSAFRFPSILSELDSGFRFGLLSFLLQNHIVAPPVVNEACATDWLAGASVLVRREVFEQVGTLDEEYFMYFEETDFCLKAKRAGWKSQYQPASRVIHLVGQSSGINQPDSRPKRLPKYWFDSRRRYFLKNHGALYAMAVDFVWSVSYAIWFTRSRLVGKVCTDPPFFFRDSLKNSVFFRGFAL
jgi:N-acetylglucosaminyl-diphospho-decaprenol L-rhamnosyltransferase